MQVPALLGPTELSCRGAGEVGVFIREPLLQLWSEFTCISACCSCHKPEVMSFVVLCVCALVVHIAVCCSVIPDPPGLLFQTFLVNLLSLPAEKMVLHWWAQLDRAVLEQMLVFIREANLKFQHGSSS